MQIYIKNKLRPTPLGGHVFWNIIKAWTILVEGHQSSIPAKLHWIRSNGFLQGDFLSFLYRYIGKKATPHLAAMFFDESWRLEQS